jgi:hypothetical protein
MSAKVFNAMVNIAGMSLKKPAFEVVNITGTVVRILREGGQDE